MEINSIHIDHIVHGDTYNSRYYSHAKTSSYFIIFQIIDGHGKFSLNNGEEYVLKGMDCFLAPAKRVHKYEHYPIKTTNSLVRQWIACDIEINQKYKLGDIFDIPPILPNQYNNAVYSIIRNIAKYSRDNESFCLQLIECYKLLNIILEFATPKSSIDNDILKVIGYIETNFQRKYTVEDMANIAKMSTSHFHHSFKKQTDSSPIDYLNNHRLMIATSYLENTNNSMNSIAAQVGFNEPYYFSRLFQNKFGMTPSEYRKKIRFLEKN